MPPTPARPASRKDLGDFQTPPGLVDAVLGALRRDGGPWSRALEPTCGRGHFIAGLLDGPDPPAEIFGYELQPAHAGLARSLADRAGRTRLVIEAADVFAVDFGRDPGWLGGGPLLVVGNLPWVTTAGLGASGGSNGPARSNPGRARGIDAMTGSSNFDISEAIWLKLIRELADQRPTIALLCKSAVARAVLRAVRPDGLPVARATIRRVDAPRWFGASVDACLLSVEVGPGPRATTAAVYADLQALEPESTLGLGGSRLIADAEAHRAVAFADTDAPGPLQWRQGVKHDAGPVMELTRPSGDALVNKLGEFADVEEDYVYPLRKGTDLAGPSKPRPPMFVIATQRRLGDDTRTLALDAPRLWSYLQRHAEVFDRRKSSIYRGRPPFAMFGVGDYTFSPYKVAISGLHKAPRFRVLGPVDGRATLVDDTCYFLPCRTLGQATLLAETLNGPVALTLIRSLAFGGAKRPITKALLRRVDLRAILDHDGRGGLWREEWATDWAGKAAPTT